MSAPFLRARTQRIATSGLLAGLSLVALASYVTPALAANECGATANGSVICGSGGNPYADGITYVTPGDVSITTNADVVAQGTVSATSNTGVAIVISNGQVVTAAKTTDGITAVAPGNVAIVAAAVRTSGTDSAGLFVKSSSGSISINSGVVAVFANGGAGILALGQAAITITSGSASAHNESAIYARSQSGPVSLTLTGANSSTTADAAVTLISGSTIAVTVAQGASATGLNALALSSLTTSTVTNAGVLTGTGGYAILAKFGKTSVINSGSINAGVEFVGAGSALVNTGTFNATQSSTFGTGIGGTLTNSGLVQVTAAAPTAGITLYGLASFANSGTLSVANGRAGDVLTLPGSFTGSGASKLIIDTAFAVAPDQLVVGGAATGITAVQVVSVNGGGGLLNPGTTIVRAGAGTSATAFQLAPTSVSAGFVQYAIAFNAAANTFSLIATPSVAAYRPLVYAEGARNTWYKTSEVWEAHMNASRDRTGDGSRLWGQFYGSADTRHDTISTTVFGQTAAAGLSYRQNTFGGQLGLDLSRPQSRGGVTFGITGGYVHSDMQFLGESARASYSVANAGGYASFHVGGVFVNVLGQYAHYHIEASDPSIDFSQPIRGHAFGATAEAGLRFGDTGFFVEPLVTMSYVRTHLDSFTALSSNFDFHDTDGIRGKIGARFGTSANSTGDLLIFYGGGNIVKTFQGRDTLIFTNNSIPLSFGDNLIGIYGEGYAGLSVKSRGHVSGFFEAYGDYGGRDAQRGGGVRAGLRLGF